MKTWLTIIGVSAIMLFVIAIPHFNGWKPPQTITIATGPEVAMGTSEEGHDHKRSTEWPRVRAEHLKKYPVCEACGQNDKLQVHHVLPFHLDPKLELDPKNLITLCTDGPCHINCHFIWGHLGNTKCNNPNVREDAAFFRKRLENRPCD